ncbi:unnamed protein product, partial [Discosporangium mesarthrocarpum]
KVTTHELKGHGAEVWLCSFSNDGQMLATVSADGCMILWFVDHPENDTRKTKPQLRDGLPHTLAWSPDGTSILTGAESPVIRRWSSSTGEEVGVYECHTENVTSLVWLPDGRGFISAGLDRL